MKISALPYILCALAGLTAASPAFGAAGLEGLKNNVSNSMALLKGNLTSFADLPCLRPDAKEHMQDFQTDTAGMSSFFNNTHRNFMARVQKPIEGNGKCEGGFNAVAKGATDRAWDSYEWGLGVYSLQTRFSQSFDDHVNSQALHIADTPGSGACEFDSIEMYKGIQQNGDLVNSSLSVYRTGVKAVQDGFVKYYSANSTLEGNCGSLDKQMVSFAEIDKGIGSVEVPQGKSFNPSSTITGKIKKEDLSNVPDGNTGPLRAKPDYAEAGSPENGLSSITSDAAAAAGAPSLSRTDLAARRIAEKDAILRNGVGKLSVDTGDNLAKSEELAVKQMLLGKGADGRSPASMQDQGALEALVSAQQQQLSAQTAAERAANEPAGAASDTGVAANGANGSGDPVFSASSGVKPLTGYSSQQSSMSQSSPAHLGSPDESLFSRTHTVLRQTKRELESRRK